VSKRENIAIAARTASALRAADVIRPISPLKLWRAGAAGHALQATPAASIAIAAATDSNGVAIVDDDGQLTWAQLDRRARALAHAFVSTYGAGAEHPIALICRNHRAVLEVLAAGARAGADVLALNTEFAAPQLAAALRGRGVAVVVHDSEFTAVLEQAELGVPLLCAWHDGDQSAAPLEVLARAPASLDAPPPRRSQITILTSGTTGVPKAASRDISARTMVGSLVTLVEHLHLRRGNPVLVAPPLFHGFGLGVTALAQVVGAPVVLTRRFDPEQTLAAIERHAVTTLVAVPVMLQRILELEPARRERYDTKTLRSVLSAGAPLAPALAERFMDAFGDILNNAYGSTETGFGAIASPADLRAAPGTIGRPPFGVTVQILDQDRRSAATGETGHIFIGSDLVIDGYADGTSKELAGSLMNTGDLGHIDGAGRIYVEGREDDMIVSGGENVFPQEVEDALLAHPSVRDATVVGVPDEEFGQRLRAFVVPRAAHSLTADQLQAHLRSRLERYKLPREIVFYEEIPRTPTGKVIRRLLTTA
jgi:acyl-CoA synthetase (AMP-forming)/AMP-acid ligase II